MSRQVRIRTATNQFREGWTAEFTVVKGRAIGELHHDGRWVKNFNVKANPLIAVSIGSSGAKINFKLKESKHGQR